jgi:hypothetical protein
VCERDSLTCVKALVMLPSLTLRVPKTPTRYPARLCEKADPRLDRRGLRRDAWNQ